MLESEVEGNNFCVQIADVCLGKCVAAEDLVAIAGEFDTESGCPG